MTEKYEYCSTVPRTFVQNCSFVSELPWLLALIPDKRKFKFYKIMDFPYNIYIHGALCIYLELSSVVALALPGQCVNEAITIKKLIYQN